MCIIDFIVLFVYCNCKYTVVTLTTRLPHIFFYDQEFHLVHNIIKDLKPLMIISSLSEALKIQDCEVGCVL